MTCWENSSQKLETEVGEGSQKAVPFRGLVADSHSSLRNLRPLLTLAHRRRPASGIRAPSCPAAPSTTTFTRTSLVLIMSTLMPAAGQSERTCGWPRRCGCACQCPRPTAWPRWAAGDRPAAELLRPVSRADLDGLSSCDCGTVKLRFALPGRRPSFARSCRRRCRRRPRSARKPRRPGRADPARR